MSIVMKFREPVGETFTVAVAGDFCPHEKNSGQCAGEAAAIVKNILPVYSSADIRLLNWENAIDTDSEPISKSGPNLRCGKEALDFAELCRPFEDMEYCEKLFDSWCYNTMPNYYFQRLFDMPKPDENWDFSKIHLEMMPYRNLFNCESHNDILRNCGLIIEEKRTATAGELIDKIRELRCPEWLTLPEAGR